MSIVTNGLQPHDFIAQAQSYPTNITRETVVIATNANNNLKAGRVLARLSNGKYTRFVATATAPENVAVAVLLTDVDATTADKEAVAIVNGDAYLIESKLDFGTTTPTQLATAKNDLIARRFKFAPEGTVYNY